MRITLGIRNLERRLDRRQHVRVAVGDGDLGGFVGGRYVRVDRDGFGGGGCQLVFDCYGMSGGVFGGEPCQKRGEISTGVVVIEIQIRAYVHEPDRGVYR